MFGSAKKKLTAGRFEVSSNFASTSCIWLCSFLALLFHRGIAQFLYGAVKGGFLLAFQLFFFIILSQPLRTSQKVRGSMGSSSGFGVKEMSFRDSVVIKWTVK